MAIKSHVGGYVWLHRNTNTTTAKSSKVAIAIWRTQAGGDKATKPHVDPYWKPPGPPPLAKQPSARISRHGHVSSSGSERPTSIDNIEKRMQARLVAVVITLYRRYKDTHCSCPCSRSRPLLVPGFCYCFSIWCAPGIGWNPHLWAAANGICGNDLWNVRWLEAKILSQVKWIWVNQVAAGCSKLVLVRINRIYMNLWKTKLIFVVFYIHRKWRLGLNLRGILECGMRG